MSNEWRVFTDGGSRGNPGNAACAFSIQEKQLEIFHQSRFLGVMTNNEAEYWGIIDSVEFVLKHLNTSTLLTKSSPTNLVWNLDSKLVVEQVLGNWKIKEERLKPLASKAKSLLSELPIGFSIHHIYREKNSRADQLVNDCLDSV